MPSSTTTPAAIRDRIAAVISAIGATSLRADAFREHREESDFIEWCETKPASSFRRFSVEDIGPDGPPETSDGLREERTITIRVAVAYPKDARTGGSHGTARRRVMREDYVRIDKAIGMHGKANFSSPYPDATWLADGHGVDFEDGEACEFMVIHQRMIYVLTLPSPPVASFTSSATGLDATFTDTSSDNGTISRWAWTFGDGDTSSLQNPTHTYAAAGDYTVTLTVTDNEGDTDTETGSISVQALPRLFVIRGQSNATGRADVGNVDEGLEMGSTYTSALITQKTSDATTNPIGWDFDYAARDIQPYRASGQPGMGVELSMGRYLRTYVPAFAVTEPYLDKMAINGTALASWWLPGLPDDAVLPGTDNLFDQSNTRIAAMETASDLSMGAFIWIQGEADASVEAQANAYQANLQTFYDALVAAHGSSFKFVFNKLHVDCVEAFTTTVRAAQVAFAAANPTVVLVDCDDIPLPAGDVHFAGDSMVTLGNRLAEAAANALYPGRNTDRITSDAPFIQSINEPCARGTGALTAANSKSAPRIPVHEAGDDLFLVVATGLLDAAPTTPTGWTIAAQKQSVTGGNYVNVRVYHKRATAAGTTAPDVADTNNLNVALCFVVRGGAASPIDTSSTASNDAYNVTVTLPSVTTTGTNRLVISIAAGYSGDPNIGMSGWTNAALTDLAEYRDSAFNVNGAGDGMFIAVAAGVKATAGATGATAVTPSNISINCGITLAIAP